jgi:hypothetical protein
MLYTLRFFFSSKCSLFHNANMFGSYIIHILYTGCAKIKKNSGAKGLIWKFLKLVWSWTGVSSLLFLPAVVATHYALEHPEIGIFRPVQTGPEAHPASCTAGTGSSPEVKQPGSCADHSELRISWSYTSASPLYLSGNDIGQRFPTFLTRGALFRINFYGGAP